MNTTVNCAGACGSAVPLNDAVDWTHLLIMVPDGPYTGQPMSYCPDCSATTTINAAHCEAGHAWTGDDSEPIRTHLSNVVPLFKGA